MLIRLIIESIYVPNNNDNNEHNINNNHRQNENAQANFKPHFFLFYSFSFILVILISIIRMDTFLHSEHLIVDFCIFLFLNGIELHVDAYLPCASCIESIVNDLRPTRPILFEIITIIATIV